MWKTNWRKWQKSLNNLKTTPCLYPWYSIVCEYIIFNKATGKIQLRPCRAEKVSPLSRLLDMKEITTTNAVITAFPLINYNSFCDGMTVNWQHNTEILHGEKHAIPKIVKIPIIDTIEKIMITLDYGTIEGKVQGL